MTKCRTLFFSCCAALAAACCGMRSEAQTSVWINSEGGQWDDSGNWLDGQVPAGSPGSVVTFLTELSAEKIISLGDSDVTVGTMIIEDDGYRFGQNIVTSPIIAFDNGMSPAQLVFTNANTSTRSGKFFYPVLVPGTLNIDSSGAGNLPMYFSGGFVGGSNAVLNIKYKLTGGSPLIELRRNGNFYGTVNLMRSGPFDQQLGFSFHQADSFFGGPERSTRVYPGVHVQFRTPPTEEDAAKFDMIGTGQSVKFTSSATFANLPGASALVPSGGILSIYNDSSSAIQRFRADSILKLDNTAFKYTGYKSTPGVAYSERLNRLEVSGGCGIEIENGTREESSVAISFDDFIRHGNATLVICGTGTGSPAGSSEMNMVKVDEGLPGALESGMLPPCFVDQNNTQTTNGVFVRYGEYGFVPFYGYGATNDFSRGASVTVLQNEEVDLGGGDASCLALRSTHQVKNGRLTIASGGLILGGAFKNYTAELFFGEGGSSTAYVHFDGHSDKAKLVTISGAIHCGDLVKFGKAKELILAAENDISGDVELQAGGFVLSNRMAIGPGSRVFFGKDAALMLNSSDGVCETGGLTGGSLCSVSAYVNNPQTLRVTVPAGTTNEFCGTLSDGSGKLSLEIAGGGVQSINGEGDCSGNILVSPGSGLILGEFASLENLSGVDAGDGSYLGGSGSFGGTLSLSGTTILELVPGNPLRAGSLVPCPDAVAVIDVSNTVPFREGQVICFEDAFAKRDLPEFVLRGAPTATRGKYEAVYDEDLKGISVRLVIPQAMCIIVD